MTTITDKTQRMLLKKFHTLCGKAGINNDEKRVIVAAYGCVSSRELNAQQLLDACAHIERQLEPQTKEMDMWRKRLIAAIFAWRKAVGRDANMGEVKAIACRAGEVKRFNDLPVERLRSLYYAFTKKAKDLAFVEMITAEELDYSTWIN